MKALSPTEKKSVKLTISGSLKVNGSWTNMAPTVVRPAKLSPKDLDDLTRILATYGQKR